MTLASNPFFSSLSLEEGAAYDALSKDEKLAFIDSLPVDQRNAYVSRTMCKVYAEELRNDFLKKAWDDGLAIYKANHENKDEK